MGKSLLVIGARSIGDSTSWIMEESKRIFENVQYVPVNEIALRLGNDKSSMYFDGKEISDYDYCLPRIDSKRAQHGFHVLRFMENLGMKKPYTSDTILIAHNKYMSLDVLRKAGIAVPETYLVSSRNAAEKVLLNMEYPVIIKIVSGFGGKGVMLLENRDAALSVVETLKIMGHQIIIEEYLKNPGEDNRAYIIGGEVVATYKRKCRKDDFRSNIMVGGKAEYCNISEEMKNMAISSAEASGSSILAVDMLETPDGPKVVEININPGLKGIQPFVNVAKLIAEYAHSQS